MTDDAPYLLDPANRRISLARPVTLVGRSPGCDLFIAVGMRFDDYLEQEVYGPLGLARTTLLLPQPPRLRQFGLPARRQRRRHRIV